MGQRDRIVKLEVAIKFGVSILISREIENRCKEAEACNIAVVVSLNERTSLICK
jgi:hypothetical protein